MQRDIEDQTTVRRPKEAGSCVAHRAGCLKAVDVWRTDPDRYSIDLRFAPGNRERDRRVQKRTEVMRIIRVFSEIVPINNNNFAKGLLNADIKLIPIAHFQRLRSEAPEHAFR
jgi:hypothetical protein